MVDCSEYSNVYITDSDFYFVDTKLCMLNDSIVECVYVKCWMHRTRKHRRIWEMRDLETKWEIQQTKQQSQVFTSLPRQT